MKRSSFLAFFSALLIAGIGIASVFAQGAPLNLQAALENNSVKAGTSYTGNDGQTWIAVDDTHLQLSDGTTCSDSDSDGYWDNTCVSADLDCDDANPSVYPGATELCRDLEDNNCDGIVDEWCPATCDTIASSGNFTECFDTTVSDPNLSDIESTLYTEISALTSALSSDPAASPSLGEKTAAHFTELYIGDNSDTYARLTKDTFAINTSSPIGAVFYNANTSDNAFGLGIEADGTIGLYGSAQGSGSDAGIDIDAFGSIAPSIGLYAKSSDNIGVYSTSSVLNGIGTYSYGTLLGHFAEGGDVGIIATGETGLSVKDSSDVFGDVFGAVTDVNGNVQAWGAIGVAGSSYGVLTPFDAKVGNVEAKRLSGIDAIHPNLTTFDLTAQDSDTTVSVPLTLRIDSVLSSVSVDSELSVSGTLSAQDRLDLDGSVRINGSQFQVDGDISGSSSGTLILNGSVAADSNVSAEGAITSKSDIGSMYSRSSSNSWYDGTSSPGRASVSCQTGDFIVSCGSLLKSGNVGVRPVLDQDKTIIRCEAYSQTSTSDVQVYAYCFDPSGSHH